MPIKIWNFVIIIFFLVIGSVSCIKSGNDSVNDTGDQSPGMEQARPRAVTPPDVSHTSDPPSNSADRNVANDGNGNPPNGQPVSEIPSYTDSMPEGWPDSVPVMAGFTVTTGTTSSQRGVLAVNAGGQAPIDNIVAFYANLEGWQKDESDPAAPWITEGDVRQLKLVKGTENLIVNVQYFGTVDNHENFSGLTLTYFVKE